ncbi:formiminoglutamate deiminase [Jatrophihabitans sp. GAS493]|uniref:formimidoylglutamate deiminase n=1 Tax=Jatrophihabitans sp. GAS493 TaxID=1907575 RepID=UPI000BB8834C|nr:formimidoylglutamate deiminase [Jatrophihabitans sp. GAS493]SOD70853.1 formiminoglutamate deiminase [Jatrophihabitans sp. GAS493]
MTNWWCEYAYLPTGLARDVRLEVRDGRYAAITPNSSPDAASIFAGLALPGFANAHSHAFHRALRGRTHDGGGTFWTWRERMYQVAQRLNPDTYLALARATYAEMALAGITGVGEFHYLHHGPGGSRYDDPNAMGHALIQAARDAGIRLTLLDTCYLAGGLDGGGHTGLNEVQQRFSDGTVERWEARVSQLEATEQLRIGVGIHSVRAVPQQDLAAIARAAGGRPLHFHLSEQPAENEATLAFYGQTPTELLDGESALGPNSTAVHATHLTAADIKRLGATHTTACFCPTTERDLADGIGPARALADAGSPLSLGSDQHAVIDLLEEARTLELHERLASNERGRFTLPQLQAALTAHAGIGFDDAGALAVGQRADLVTVDLNSTRTAGVDPAQLIFAATAADIRDVCVDGRRIVTGGQHILGDVGALLRRAIDPLYE